jgi:hypothetical protein
MSNNGDEQENYLMKSKFLSLLSISVCIVVLAQATIGWDFISCSAFTKPQSQWAAGLYSCRSEVTPARTP